MSLYAFDNKEKRGKRVKADVTTADQTELLYYCSDETCPATMHLCAYKASDIRAPYFSAYSKTPHRQGCSSGSKGVSGTDRSKINDSGFDPGDFLNALMNPKTKTSPTREKETAGAVCTAGDSKRSVLPYRLPAVYTLCHGNAIGEPFGCDGKETIGKFLADSRSNHIFSRGIFGPRMIECCYNERASNAEYLRFQYPLNLPAENQYDILFRWKDIECQESLRKKLRGCDGRPIIIMGHWKTKGSTTPYCECELKSFAQVYIPPPHKLNRLKRIEDGNDLIKA